VHHQLGQTQQERQVLDELAALSADAADAFGRLMEIGIEQKDWRQVLRNGDRYLAVYPLLSAVHWRMGLASEGLGQEEQAVESYRRLLLLDPSDPVEVNYRLACLLEQRDPAAAKRYVLDALADAPRFRSAHRLLLKLGDTAGAPSATAPNDRSQQPTGPGGAR
jgi:tetratricopeptide (TPR) repeat protein